MQHSLIDFENIPALSARDKAYARGDKRLSAFYKYEVNLSSFKQVIEDKSREKTDRKTLVEALRQQYINIAKTAAVQANITSLLDKNTFTVTTAHQPSLATGPLYFIYKIISTINLAENLRSAYPNKNFVPVYIQGSEDHDFEEINHFHLFGKRFTWENEEGGSVGKMTTKGIHPILPELQAILGESENAKAVYELINKAYSKHDNYDDATFFLVNELFAKYGLVVVIGSVPALKRLFIPIMQRELVEQSSEQLVLNSIAALKQEGFKGQATPRAINLFYLGNGFRERIILEDEVYKVLNTQLIFSRDEILLELQNHPERFSPNVIMRPLYQETFLPNLAYIGGGGELAYWMERLAQFEHFGINFPMLIRRDSVLWIDKSSQKKIDKLGLTIKELFMEEEALAKRFVQANSSAKVNLAEEKKVIEQIYQQALEKALKIDVALQKSVLAEKTKALKGLEQLENKLLRAEKRKFDVAIQQIRGLKSKLFPDSGLQERKDNFLALYTKHGESFIEELKQALNPMKKQFNVFINK